MTPSGNGCNVRDMETAEAAVTKWVVYLAEREDPDRPIVHPAETTECWASDGWTEQEVIQFAKSNHATRVRRVRT